jgi:CheY-like chemotaxis protein
MATLLLVEDDPITRMYFARVLRAEGHYVVEAADGREAFEKAISIEPDAMVIDLWMPAVDGLAFLEHARRTTTLQKTPAVIITGDYIVDEARLRRVGELQAIVKYKPVWVEELSTIVDDLLGGAQPADASCARDIGQSNGCM